MTVAKKWLIVALVVLVVLGLPTLSPWAILIRADPMYADDDNIIENMACDYSSGLRIATVFIIGDKHGARCPSYYRFGTITPCVGTTDLPPGVCLWSQGLIFFTTIY